MNKMDLTITKERVENAIKTHPESEGILKALFPEMFKVRKQHTVLRIYRDTANLENFLNEDLEYGVYQSIPGEGLGSKVSNVLDLIREAYVS